MVVPQDVNALCPINPAYMAYRDRVLAGTWDSVSTTGRGLGHIPPLFVNDPNLPPGRDIVGAYPDDYVLPSADLPPIRNQGSCGSCWAFATYGSMETCALVASDDGSAWSENNLKNNHGYDLTCCYGGHCYMSMAYLARWDGPVTEAADPYKTTCTGNAGAAQRHVQDVWCLPTDDPSVIKDMIHQYGGVYTSYYNPGTGAYYNATFTAYYYPPDGTQEQTSHAVTIVGWDDNYSRSNFGTDPGVDGAWFVRNSWGNFNPPLGGYEWVSYNDKFMGKSLNALFLPPEATGNLAYCYQYDPLGEVVTWGSGSTGFYRWMANIFPRVAVGGEDRQQLEAVSFYTTSAANSYILEIRRDCNTTNPRTGGTLAHNSSGTLTYEGYHTLHLDPPVDILATDTRFSVTVRVGTGAYQLALEYPYPGFASGATASAGQSFYSSNGTSWTDMTSTYANTNLCIKAWVYPGALPVRLSDLRAEGGHGQVRVTWETANEVGTTGFIVVRSERPEGPFEPVHGSVVVAEGQPGQVMRYGFVDETAQPGRIYYYRIREVYDSGTINEIEDTAKAVAGGAGLYDLVPAQIRALLPL